MFLFKKHPNVRLIGNFIRFFSVIKNSHYDLLNLKKNCTDKEIKEAFIHLSKEYHPDLNKKAHAQEHFIKILEAYNVLSKPKSRARYDKMLDYGNINHVNHYHQRNPYGSRKTYSYDYRNTYSDYNTYSSHNTSSSTIRKKIPNYVLVLVCFGIAFAGAVLQVVIIRVTYLMNKERAQEKTRRLAEELERVRATAKIGNEAQTRLLLEKIVTAANPTVATASLGHTLADEKKYVF